MRTIQDNYIALYKEQITQLHINATSIRILAKGYLTISHITPSKLQEILSKVKIDVRKTNPNYDLVKDRLHLYYDMKLSLLALTKKVIDQNTDAQSYTHLQVDKPYIALNSETYIMIRQQELRTCKRIGYKFYC